MESVLKFKLTVYRKSYLPATSNEGRIGVPSETLLYII